MIYARGQFSDFDSWNTEGWTSQDLLPYLKKFETHHGKVSTAVHGLTGPVNISDGGFRVPRAQQDMIEACERAGLPTSGDVNDLQIGHGAERHFGNVSPDGRRQDTAHTHLHPLLAAGEHPHLHVVCEHRVSRILFDSDKRATSVEFTSSNTNDTHIVRARKQVILSTGTIGTAAVLERSGVGSRKVLEQAGIPVIEDLPGVGEGCQDHPLLWTPYETNLNPDETGDALATGKYLPHEALAKKDPMLGWNFVDVLAKCRPSEAEVVALGPDFQKIWDRDFRDKPERPLTLCAFAAYINEWDAPPQPGQHMSAVTYSAYPYGRGRVHITGPGLDDQLDIDSGYLGAKGAEFEFDMQTHVWAYKKFREIMRRTKMYRGEPEVAHPKFGSDSAARAVSFVDQEKSLIEQGPVEDLQYSEADDEALRKYIAGRVGTAGHSLGTAKMAPREEMGVVDKDLNVYGVKDLKVADMSIVPQNVGANTCNTAMLVGEKAAAIILNELGLKDGVIPKQR